MHCHLGIICRVVDVIPPFPHPLLLLPSPTRRPHPLFVVSTGPRSPVTATPPCPPSRFTPFSVPSPPQTQPDPFRHQHPIHHHHHHHHRHDHRRRHYHFYLYLRIVIERTQPSGTSVRLSCKA